MRAPRPRIYHLARRIRGDGAVSALCFKMDWPIDLRHASWTIRFEAVTCPKCRALLKPKKATAS